MLMIQLIIDHAFQASESEAEAKAEAEEPPIPIGSAGFCDRKPWLVGGLEHFLFFHILRIIMPID